MLHNHSTICRNTYTTLLHLLLPFLILSLIFLYSLLVLVFSFHFLFFFLPNFFFSFPWFLIGFYNRFSFFLPNFFFSLVLVLNGESFLLFLVSRACWAVFILLLNSGRLLLPRYLFFCEVLFIYYLFYGNRHLSLQKTLMVFYSEISMVFVRKLIIPEIFFFFSLVFLFFYGFYTIFLYSLVIRVLSWFYSKCFIFVPENLWKLLILLEKIIVLFS